jgi:mannose-6-phosphate isomerase-like protein (cupin superfamily)
MQSEAGRVTKSWGYEDIIFSNHLYCTKYLVFTTEAKDRKTSMHFHANKKESWLVVAGRFKLHFIDTMTGKLITNELKEGDKWENDPHEPHQLESVDGWGMVLETSTRDDMKDNYRVYR